MVAESLACPGGVAPCLASHCRTVAAGLGLAILFKTHFKRNLSLFKQIVEPCTVMHKSPARVLEFIEWFICMALS